LSAVTGGLVNGGYLYGLRAARPLLMNADRGSIANRLFRASLAAENAGLQRFVTGAPRSGVAGLVSDIGTGVRLTARQFTSQLNTIWSPEIALAALLANVTNARRVGYVIYGSERILRRHVARIAAANPGISSSALGILAGRAAERDIVRYAKRLGLNAQSQQLVTLPSDLIAFADEGLASFRIADIVLPNQRLVLELTLESAQEFASLSIRKQGQLADYYLAHFRPIIVNPH
jgi:hypothetical protein